MLPSPLPEDNYDYEATHFPESLSLILESMSELGPLPDSLFTTFPVECEDLLAPPTPLESPEHIPPPQLSTAHKEVLEEEVTNWGVINNLPCDFPPSLLTIPKPPLKSTLDHFRNGGFNTDESWSASTPTIFSESRRSEIAKKRKRDANGKFITEPSTPSVTEEADAFLNSILRPYEDVEPPSPEKLMRVSMESSRVVHDAPQVSVDLPPENPSKGNDS